MIEQVTVVIINYARPWNIPRVLDHWKDQSIPVKTLLVHAPLNPAYELQPPVKYSFDEVVEMRNVGGYTRYLVAPLIETPYVIFADDDFCPGYAVAEYYLEIAKVVLFNRFACLGEMGRHVPADLSYSSRDVLRSHLPKRVDFVCRLYFYNSHHLPFLDASRRSLQARLPQSVLSNGFPREDDIFAQVLIQMQTGYDSFIVPAASEENKAGICIELPDNGGNRYQPEHRPVRNETIHSLVQMGWIPQSRSKGCRSCGNKEK